LSSLVSAFLSSLLEFDEVAVRMVDENTVEYQIITTGMAPGLVELKTKIWSYLAPPVKHLEVTDIRVVERGVVADRYLVTIRGRLRPELRGRLRERVWPAGVNLARRR